MGDAQCFGVSLEPYRVCSWFIERGLAAANGQEGEYIRSNGYNHHFILESAAESTFGVSRTEPVRLSTVGVR